MPTELLLMFVELARIVIEAAFSGLSDSWVEFRDINPMPRPSLEFAEMDNASA